jgi:hypothetical protein
MLEERPLKTQTVTIDGMVEHVLAGIRRRPTVILGPVVWRPKDDGTLTMHKTFDPVWGRYAIELDDRLWYFVCASGGSGTSRFEVDQMAGPGKAQAITMRAQLRARLTQHRPAVVIHEFADELTMARCCEAVWSSAKAREIRQGIETDRAIHRH